MNSSLIRFILTEYSESPGGNCMTKCQWSGIKTVATIENGKGVVIKASATESSGAQVSLSAGGLKIEFAE